MDRISAIRSRRERVFYKKRLAGKRARELAAARKLVAENEHLLPRLRGSEKRRLAELAAERGVQAEELDAETVEGVLRAGGKRNAVAFGGEVRRKRLMADGGVEEVVERVGGVVGEEDEDDDDPDDMDMD
jgi:large subunit ribosomal protein L24e